MKCQFYLTKCISGPLNPPILDIEVNDHDIKKNLKDTG